MGIYNATKWIVRNGLLLFFRRLHLQGMQNIPESGPVLLVANHPNTFLDALLIASFLKRPIHFLARGDAFNNPMLAAIFRAYNMLPVYRISEGKENIGKNTSTFDVSHELLRQQGIVLIFGEGKCEQNWDLRPLKKGAARIAERAWSDPLTANMVIVPIGLTYEHFEGAGKSVMMQFGEPIIRTENTTNELGASFVKWLNSILTERLRTLAYVNPSLKPESIEHHQLIHTWKQAEHNNLNVLTTLYQSHSTILPTSTPLFSTRFHKALITIPHYWMMQSLSKLFTKGTAFYDSILFVMVVLLLPAYIGTLVYLLITLL
ncbi:MAG: 1-acyl-sn-glycerol-3-phosphate acyltransferase [Bacteroidota bacterium]